MEMEAGGLTGAGHGEKSADRLVQRNGYRDRDWHTRAARSNCASPSCVKAAIFLDFWSRAGWPTGADGGHPGSLRAWHLDALGR
jgi:hypothetical protein